MRIQYNQGLFTQNRYNHTNTELNKTLNKLSSGYKINQAADDAAGLSISEKMRAQIRGLNQAGENIQDGLSLINTADRGLANILDPNLQRLRELAVQASNDTLTDDDRQKGQQEVDQIIKGISDIASNTEFNDMFLLAGKYDKDGKSITSGSIAQYVQQVTTSGGVTDKYTYNSIDYASAMIDFSNINSASDVAKLDGKGVSYTCCTCNQTYSIKFVNGNPDTSRLNAPNPVMEVDVSTIANGTDLVNKIIETAYGQPGFVYDPTPTNSNTLPNGATSFVKHYSQLASDGGKIYIYDYRPENYGINWPNNDSGVFELNVFGETEEEKDLFLHLDIQVGSNSGQSVRVSIPNVTVEKLNIDPLPVNSQENANLAITKIDNAILKASNARSTIGAYQNKFEHAYNNVKNAEENLTKAESTIRDADMAKEMSKLKKDQVLLQSSQSMMAQINQMSQGILEILG
ncbi:flagellin [Psychrobacillus sp. FJAT-21963]|uniref:flagellin N-terminal helical domain-containing protein n=1 Tax=Psychrobacillus sp. FJAT-21963 TaxID=1712028 RepID=UPI0006FB0EE7|nr:flagellin [Psychrobacillus sp. FJAT-21963]KQL34717.1 flagellar protein [Psychrobacillus sp. FJAT-21963]